MLSIGGANLLTGKDGLLLPGRSLIFVMAIGEVEG